MEMESGYIEVDLFSEDVDSPYHPEAERFRELLEEVAEEYECSLVHFDVEKGSVTFSFDSNELMAQILKVLKNDGQSES